MVQDEREKGQAGEIPGSVSVRIRSGEFTSPDGSARPHPGPSVCGFRLAELAVLVHNKRRGPDGVPGFAASRFAAARRGRHSLKFGTGGMEFLMPVADLSSLK